MENANPLLEAEIHRSELAERITRARAPRIPTTTRRHQLARGLRRFATWVEN